MKIRLLALCCILLVSACAPTASTPTVVPVAVTNIPTLQPQPTATPTVAPTSTRSPQVTSTPPPTATNTVVPTLAPTRAPTIAPQATVAAVSLIIKGFIFKPEVLQVKVGTTVTWTNMDDIQHSVTNGTPPTPAGAFDSGFFAQGNSFSFTFTQPGDYPYFCKRHNSMTAMVRVTAQ